MASTGSVVDYKNRLADLLAFQGIDPGEETLVALVLAAEGESGLLVTGIAKLAQRFLLELLTEQGTLPYDTKRGTTFMTELRQNRVRTTVDAERAFFFAIDQARLNLQQEETDNMPDDERFRRVELVSIVLAPADTLKLRIRLFSLSDETVQLILPLRTTLG